MWWIGSCCAVVWRREVVIGAQGILSHGGDGRFGKLVFFALSPHLWRNCINNTDTLGCNTKYMDYYAFSLYLSQSSNVHLRIASLFCPQYPVVFLYLQQNRVVHIYQLRSLQILWSPRCAEVFWAGILEGFWIELYPCVHWRQGWSKIRSLMVRFDECYKGKLELWFQVVERWTKNANITVLIGPQLFKGMKGLPVSLAHSMSCISPSLSP